MSKELQLYWDHCCHRNHQLKKRRTYWAKFDQKGPKSAKKGQMSKELQLYWNHSCHCNHQLKRNKTNRALRALELVIHHIWAKKRGPKWVKKG